MTSPVQSPADEALDSPTTSLGFSDADFARAALVYAGLRDEATRRHFECVAMLSDRRSRHVSAIRDVLNVAARLLGQRRPAVGLAARRRDAAFREALRNRMHARVGARACLRWLAGPALCSWRPSGGGH